MQKSFRRIAPLLLLLIIIGAAATYFFVSRKGGEEPVPPPAPPQSELQKIEPVQEVELVSEQESNPPSFFEEPRDQEEVDSAKVAPPAAPKPSIEKADRPEPQFADEKRVPPVSEPLVEEPHDEETSMVQPQEGDSPGEVRTVVKDWIRDLVAWLWFGIGANYQYYLQTVPDLGEARFENIVGPTWLVRAGVQSALFGVDLSYKDTPGKMNSSETVVISNGDYNWKTYSGEILYRFSRELNWTLRAGFQHHLAPFMHRDPIDPVIEVRNVALTMLTAGFDRVFPISDWLRFEWQMRYQHPLLARAVDGTEFNVKTTFNFDGSLGAVMAVGERARIGLFWYGQWHQYQFNYGGSNTWAFSGDQTLFYSNLELRFGLEF